MSSNIDRSCLPRLNEGIHDLGKNVQKNRLTFALTVIGLIGMTVTAVGLTALGTHQGWWSAGALASVSQVNAITTMAAGSSIFLGSLVALVLSSICRKRGYDKQISEPMLLEVSDGLQSHQKENSCLPVGSVVSQVVVPEFEALTMSLDSWVSENAPGELRIEARSRILAFINNPESTRLSLLNLNISSLPNIFAIHRGFNRLISLNLADNLLTTLQGLENLRNLEILSLGRNQLTSLPGLENLRNLKILHLVRNRLTTLPGLENLRNLKILSLWSNQLTALPSFENLTNLQRLVLGVNRLTTLQGLENLTSLHELHLPYNQLITLQGLGSLVNLQKLDLKHNPHLTSLPNDILLLPSTCEVDISGTDLSTEFLNTLQTTVSAEGYAGPRISFGISEEPLSLSNRSSEDLLREIYELTELPFTELKALLSHEEKDTLQLWLNKLSCIAEFKNGAELQKALLKHVVTYLELAENGLSLKDKPLKDFSFRESFFLILSEATGTCGDRMALSIVQLAIASKLSTMELSDCKKVADFLVRGVWAIDILREHAMKKVTSLKFFDEIEVYLAYPIKLKEALGLPIPLEDMLYFNFSSVTEKDLEEARKDVEKAFADFDAKCQFLIGQDKWLEALSQNYTEKVQQLKDKLADNDYSSEAFKIYNKELFELTKEVFQENPKTI